MRISSLPIRMVIDLYSRQKDTYQNLFGVTFLEGVGQLIQRVTNNMDEHYLVLPDTPRHRNQARNIHLFVRKALKIGFFFANDNGQLRKYRASEKVDAKEGGTLIYASNLH